VTRLRVGFRQEQGICFYRNVL